MKRKHMFSRLLGYEIRKNFLSPWVLLFLAVLLAVNGWKLTSEYQDQNRILCRYQSVYNTVYDRWKGPIGQDNVGQLMSLYGPLRNKSISGAISKEEGTGTYTESEYNDLTFLETLFYREMRYDYEYRNYAIQVSGQAEQISSFHEARGDDLAAARNDRTARMFYGRAIPSFADTHYMDVWLNYDYSSMLVMLLCLFGLSTVFVSERETQMYMLLRTARRGGGSTVAAKLLASFLYVALICLVFYAQDFLVLQLLSGHWEALSSPAYALADLERTPLNLTIGQLILFYDGMKLWGMLLFGALVLLLSCLCKRVLTTFVAGLAAGLAAVTLQQWLPTLHWLKLLNPAELIFIRDLTLKPEYVPVFGMPVPLHLFVGVGLLPLLLLLCVGILLRSPGRTERRCSTC